MAAFRGWAIFAHCFTCGKSNIAAVRIARALAAHGIGVLRFDFAGVGDNELPAHGFAGDVRDLVTAADAMTASGRPVSLLVGHSLGGAAVLAAAGEIPSVSAVATLAAPFDVAHVLEHFDPAALDAIISDGEGIAHLAGRPFRVSKGFVDDVRSHVLGDRIGHLDKALLVMHAPRDETVGIDNATRIFQAARHPKSFVSLDDADHLLTRQPDTDYAVDVIVTWAARYLPVQAPAPLSESATEAEAEETGQGPFQLSMRTGGIRFFADEPVSHGGTGTGPSPYDLLCAALSACTTMTLRLYADRKGLPVHRIRTWTGHHKVADGNPPDVFSRRIAVEGDLTTEQRQRLLEIADRCPVHRTLETGSAIGTEMENASAD